MNKRLFDLISSSAGLYVLSPLFLLTTIVIKLDSKGPVFFKQDRVGKSKKIFKIIKFRTMIADAEKVGSKITSQNDVRITKVGKYLRKYKIDEFPQLLNVIVGDMSIVGPRPEVPEYYDIIESQFPEIVNMKPGITDYASIDYSNEEELIVETSEVDKIYRKIILPKKIKLYKKYYNEMSLFTDLKIIFKTLEKVFIKNE